MSDAICPAEWRGAGPTSKCELPDNLRAHDRPPKGDVPGHRAGRSFWGVTHAERARWAAIETARAL